jgi:ATP-dependent Zn protease
MSEKTTDPWAKWEPCPPDIAAAALQRITAEIPMFFSGTTLKTARWTALSFYKIYRLMEISIESEGRLERAYLLDGGGNTWWLDGVTGPIHAVNSEENLQLTEENAVDYLKFFCYFLRADEGAFALLEKPDDITALGHDDAWFADNAAKLDPESSDLWQRLQTARTGAAPLKLKEKDEEGRFIIDAAISYGSSRAAAVFAVAPDGICEMTDDETFMSMDGLMAPLHPTLTLSVKQEYEETRRPLGGEEEKEEETGDADAATAEHEVPRVPRAPSFVDQLEQLVKPSAPSFTGPGRDKEVTEAAVATLLEEAIRERDGSLLLQHFNSETAADKPIERLAKMVFSSAPVIVIESDIPFVEDFVGGLVIAANEDLARQSRMWGGPAHGDDVKCLVDYDRSGVKQYFLSFHAYRTLFDPERTAHELGIKDAAVFIGADRLSDVPEPLRRITDLVLKFPRIDRKLFSRIFERVFGVKPSQGWEGTEADWTRYLVPADFHGPRRLGLQPDDALAWLKDRVKNRLKLVSADSGPSLSELNGIGEARQIAEDLIADVRSAQAGQIPWSAVDRGFLLIGRPGTGKTTLARAIAKECGIKFVVSSATGWQAAGALDAHLRAMRADFTEARRFAPAILFIDEIDSVGNREKLSGQNAVYQTDVINGLLEQVQGFDISAPVIVIGATNYAENVDPALKRAGRLDQVVRIPLPNIDGLEKIFEYYLKSHRDNNELAPDVAPRQLAELAFGLTGADVEFFVRGADRRARREARKMSQADLLAEVTHRPRRPDSAPRLGPEEMRRVAVHEAGHTTSRLLGARRGAELSFVTIVPRMDGSLGFVASLPREGSSATRREMLEELETILAGRAAEEIVYGSADVGLGAGGASESSDLAVATSLATMLVCQSGLGANKGLHWTRTPTLVQEKQIDQLLRNTYKNVVARLRANRALLEDVARLLVEKQEIGGAELRSLTEAQLKAASPSDNGKRAKHLRQEIPELQSG